MDDWMAERDDGATKIKLWCFVLQETKDSSSRYDVVGQVAKVA